MITIKDINISFGSKKILNNLNWHIKTGKKIGLVGSNGAGKTTLLELITGSVIQDTGELSVPSLLSIGYLPQEFHLKTTDRKLLDETLSVFKEIKELESESEQLLEDISNVKDGDEQNFKNLSIKLDKVQAELKARDSDTVKTRGEKMLMGLGFNVSDLSKPLSTFSFGWRMRVEIAKILIVKPQILLLDEPTNHLDIESIAWLEGYLKSFEGTVLLVSHDKYFLDRMTEITAEIYNGKITEYKGNYSSYLEQRQSRMENQQSAYENQKRLISQYERFIERFRYKNTKARQVQSRIKMLDKMERIDPLESEHTVNFKFPETKRSGRSVFNLSSFSKSFDEETIVFEDAGPLLIERGDKIGLIGKNGIGKSTLIRIIADKEQFNGIKDFGHDVDVAYFAQNQAETLNTENTILEELQKSVDSNVHNETELRTILGAFLFSGDDVYKKIKVLSGGEKSRVALAKTLLSPKNFLILDEPTNHLDIQSRNVLMEALNQYSGTYLLVSHDRYFLDQVCNKIWYIEEKNVHEYPGNYSEYLYFKESNSNNSGLSKQLETKILKNDDKMPLSKSRRREQAEKRNTYFKKFKEVSIEDFKDWQYLTKNQLSNAIIEIENIIEKEEIHKREIEELLNKKDTYNNIDKSNELSTELHKTDSKLAVLYDKWNDVTNILEQ